MNMVAYRKPEMTIQVKSAQPFYFWGDKAKVTIQASYYFGGPVVGATLKVNVFASASWLVDPDEDSDEGDDASPAYNGGDLSKNLTVVTDSKGQAVVEFPTRQPNDKDIPLSDLDFNVNVSGSDESKKYVDCNGHGPRRAKRNQPFGSRSEQNRFIQVRPSI